MPKSRVRKSRRRTARRRRAPSSGQGRVRVATLRPGQDMTHLMTDEDIEHMDAHIGAAARGDAHEALWHLEQTLQVEGSLTPHKLQELVMLGDQAPGWMYSRWCVAQAYRWMLAERDPRTDDAVIQTMVVAHVEQAEHVANDAVSFRELGTRIAAADWLCEQLAVFEYGGLLDFLDVKADAALVERCDQIRDWAETRMNGYVLEGANGAALRVRDLSTGAPIEVMNIGALTDRGSDSPVIGRVVPVASAPGLMFESRPVSVDLATAQGVAAASTHEDSAYWITCIGDGRHDKRLEYAFSCRNRTLFSSDIVPMSILEGGQKEEPGPPPGRLVELLDQGLSEHQANGVMVAEVAFIAITVSGMSGASTVAPHVGAVILDQPVFEAMREHCTSAEHAAHWSVLADCSVEPVRSRCEELARLAAA